MSLSLFLHTEKYCFLFLSCPRIYHFFSFLLSWSKTFSYRKVSYLLPFRVMACFGEHLPWWKVLFLILSCMKVSAKKSFCINSWAISWYEGMFLYSRLFHVYELLSLKDRGIVSLGSSYAREKQVFVPVTQILTDQTRCCTIPRRLIAESLVLMLAFEIYLGLYLLLLKISYSSKCIQDF